MSSKERKIILKRGLTQMKMLNQVVQYILYLSFYFNDNVYKQYENNEINEVSFFHSNNETAKMIYRNCITFNKIENAVKGKLSVIEEIIFFIQLYSIMK